MVSQQLIQKIRTQINGKAPTRQGGVKIAQANSKKNMIGSGITELRDIKLMWATTDGGATLMVTTILIRKKRCGVTRWLAASGIKIGNRTKNCVCPSVGPISVAS